MKILKISEQKARELYRSGSQELKTILEESCGKDFFEQSIMDRIKTFEDAIEETRRPDVPDFSCLPPDMRKHFIALYKMHVISEALNEGWKPDWDNNNYKYYPWFVTSPSSFTFNDSNYDNSNANAGSWDKRKILELVNEEEED